jgi:pimeloyl-ACP methyl ester carboxylesterase
MSGELLRELATGPVYWVGHSSSCCIGLQFALDQPDLVAGLILFETAKPSGPIRDANAGSYVAPALPPGPQHHRCAVPDP